MYSLLLIRPLHFEISTKIIIGIIIIRVDKTLRLRPSASNQLNCQAEESQTFSKLTMTDNLNMFQSTFPAKIWDFFHVWL